MQVFGFLAPVGRFFLRLALSRGAKQLALYLAKQAALYYADDFTQRREWMVTQLVAKGLPERHARLLVEWAVDELKEQLN